MRDGRSWGSASFLRGASVAALVMGLAGTAAFAGGGRPVDGLDPPLPVVGPGADAGWSVSRVPALPNGATLGEVWTAPSGELWVWAAIPPAVAVTANDGEGEPGEIERPGGPDTRGTRARLYRFGGGAWTVALPAADGTPGALFGTSRDDVWATTTNHLGEVSVWHFDGTHWAAEALPTRVTGYTHAMAGEPGNVWLRVERTILLRSAGRWAVHHVLPAGVGGAGLASLGGGRVLAPTSCGHCLFDGALWHAVPEDFTFAGVSDAWGMRSPCGALCLYVAGCNEADNGLRVWRFTEGTAGSLAGCWGGRNGTVFADPPGAGVAGIGSAAHVWGSARNEVFTAGTLAGRGEIARFDGRTWTKHVPIEEMASVTGVSGTAAGGAWFALADGQVLHYRRPNTAPDASAAFTNPTALAPADGEFTGVRIEGLSDAEGDWLTVRVTGITQDEPVVEPFACQPTCPDGVAGSGLALLRAERAEGGNGRVYEIAFEVDDGFGGITPGRVHTCVPIAPGVPCVDDGQRWNSAGPCEPNAAAPSPALLATLGGDRVLRVGFRLDRAADVSLEVYDVSGRAVATLARGSLSAGAHERTWSGEGARPGVYFVRLRGAGFSTTRVVRLTP